MARYLISFDDGTMVIPDDELPEVSAASHAVVRQAKEAGVWFYGAGVEQKPASVVATDGTVSDRPYPDTKAAVGGFSIIEAGSRDEALVWATKFAVARRCAQEVRELMYDPES